MTDRLNQALGRPEFQVPFFAYFEKICTIPHGSWNTLALINYCMDFARNLGLACRQDSHNNVVITKPGTAGLEDHPPVILQGHLDMVCDCDPTLGIDMEKDPLRPVTDGEWIWAQGTTLGADDGIAVAYCLALLSARDIPHPPLEVIFTSEEEVGMQGASGLDVSDIKGKYLLNLDSEEEGVFTVGCAGGARVLQTIPIHRTPAAGLEGTLSLSGLLGGHSGAMIDMGRANACKLLGQLLNRLWGQGIALVELSGGQKDNAIPQQAMARLMVEPERADDLATLVSDFQKEIQAQYVQSDPDIEIHLMLGQPAVQSAVDAAQARSVIEFLRELPNGVQSYVKGMENLPETSLNLGILRTYDDRITVCHSVRSSANGMCAQLAQRIIALGTRAGGHAEISGVYPPWQYRAESPLRETAAQIYHELTGKDAIIDVIHAGLECGILCGKISSLDAISLGPTIQDIHTAKERLSVASAVRTWQLLLSILARL